MSKQRWIIITAISALVLLAVIYGFRARPVPVDMEKAKRAPMRVTIDEEGKTRVKDRFVVTAPVAGYLRRISLKVGDRVEKGQVVAELEPPRAGVLDPRSRAAAEAAVRSAEAALEVARRNARAAGADAEYARANLERTQSLLEAGYVSKNEMELAQTEAKRTGAGLLSAEAAVEVARFELEGARAALRHWTGGADKEVVVRAPTEGRVLKLHRESEGMVAPAEPLMDIGNPDRLEITAEVLSTEAVRIMPGSPVIFERWGGEMPLTGIVRVVEPAGFTKVSSLGVEEQKTLVISDITSTEGWRPLLGDGYKVDARFIIWEGKDVLQVPASALFRKEAGWAVFAVKKDRAEERRVELGRQSGLAAQIISGIEEGETVILHPDESIRHGARVRQR